MWVSGMESAAPRTDGRSEPGRPWVLGAVLLCAVGALGAVAKAAAPESLAGRAPGFADVFRINPGVVTVEAAVVVAAATIAGVAALWWSVRRSWPWLLVAGVALTFFAELAYPLHWTATTGDAAPFVQGTVTAGAHLVVLGTLGAGLVLVRIGAAGAGAAAFAALGRRAARPG